MSTYIVINENILGFTRPGWTEAQILAASALRGATVSWMDGVFPLPMDSTKIRPATAKDFDTFRVALPPNFQ